MAFHAPGRCFLWPCPKCFNAAKEKHKIKPKKPKKEEKEKAEEKEREKEKGKGKETEKGKDKGKETEKEKIQEGKKKKKKKQAPCSGICSLWPCPNCVKAARKRYKAKLKQEKKQETDGHPPAKPPSPPPKPNVQFCIMDHPNWFGFDHPLMVMGQDTATNGCQCGTCRGAREQAMLQQAGKAPAKPKDPVVNDGPNINLGLCNIHPMMRHIQHQQHNNGGKKQQPQQQHHVNPPPPTPSPHDGSGQIVYIWPCGVTNLTFGIVDYTRNPFAANGFPGPLFYMATLANTAKISDLVARLAPAGSGKVLMARSHKGGECFDAASATCLASLQRHALQLEVWAKGDVDGGDSEDGGKLEKGRVTSASTNNSNQSKKSKGKQNPNPARSSPFPDIMLDQEEQEADAQMVQAAELLKRSASSDRGGNDDPDDAETTVHHPLDFSPHILPYFQMMGCGNSNGNDDHGEGPSGYSPGIIHNPKTRVGGKARKASYSSDEASRELECDTEDETAWLMDEIKKGPR